MTIFELGALGEFIGAITVIATLVYIALQVQQVKKDLHISGYREINRFFNDTATLVASSPEMARVLAKIQEEEKLDAWEKLMVGEYFFSLMNSLEVAWQHVVTGTLEMTMEEFRSLVRSYLKRPGLFGWWRENKEGYPPAWVRLVEDLYGEDANEKHN